jgi:hypothetical protein
VHHETKKAPEGALQVEDKPVQAWARFGPVNGMRRMRFPVAAKIALATAGATSAVAGSPMPPGLSWSNNFGQ